jgi:hypothetical protein
MDFVLLTTVCTQLKVLNLDCEKVPSKKMVKIANLKNISDLKIQVLVKCFSPKLLSALLKNTKLTNLEVSSAANQNFKLTNSTELELQFYKQLIREKDVHKFFFPQLTKLKLTYNGKGDFVSALDELENLTELYLNNLNPDLTTILNLLDVVKRKNLRKFQTSYGNVDMYYESNSIRLGIIHHCTLQDMSKMIEKLEIFNLEKLSLTYKQCICHISTLNSIGCLKTLKCLHLSFYKFHDEDNIAETFFESLVHLELLILDFHNDNLTSNEVTFSMTAHRLKIQRRGSTIFFKKV